MSNTNTEVLTTAYEKLQGALTQANTVLPELEEAVEKGNLDNYATTSQLEEKANDISNIMKYKRKFKPELGIFMDLNPGGGNMISQTKIVENLNKLKSYGLESLVIQPWVVWDDTTDTLSFKNTPADYTFIIDKCKELGVKVASLKIHFYLVSFADIITNGKVTTFINQYKNILSTFLSGFTSYINDIESVIVLNECAKFYSSNSDYYQFAIDCVNIAKNKGFSNVGISTMGAKESVLMHSSVKESVDAFFVNVYPKISFIEDSTTVIGSQQAWEGCFDAFCIKQIKQDYPNKPLLMSETGCNDYWISLCNPGDWTLLGTTKTNGKAPKIMLEGLFTSFLKNYIDGVWWCYWDSVLNNECKELIKEYIGGYTSE